MSDTAIVELTLGVAGILVTIISAAIGSYIATRSSINDLKTELSALATQLAGFRDWLEKVSDGDTASVAEIPRISPCMRRDLTGTTNGSGVWSGLRQCSNLKSEI